ncbi:hypothetical protein [Ottowia beijingensis]|uniref:hypothetical protein n=1 Tax=Ottowia beijingensis TaxID=1207057 RepID=UPI0027DA3881|nr:hypothetical protein [Ottowia beijingensis]
MSRTVTSSTRTALTLQQAVAQAPTLARLSELAAESAARLAIVRPLLPPALRTLVQAGAPDADGWTLLAPTTRRPPSCASWRQHCLQPLTAQATR